MKKTEKPKDTIYVERNFKLNKWELIGMNSGESYGLFDSKQEAHERFLIIMQVDKIDIKKKS